MGDESNSGYTITLDGSESSLGGSLDFSNTMSDVTFTMDTSTATSTVSVPGATVGGITGGAYTFDVGDYTVDLNTCLLYTSPSPRDGLLSRMPSSA